MEPVAGEENQYTADVVYPWEISNNRSWMEVA
jgi:hypothetical protein